MMPIRTLLHPTDFSPCSAKAFQLACELARDSGARLVTLHVRDMPEIVSTEEAEFDELNPDSETFIEDLDDDQETSPVVADDSYLRIERRIEAGDPASEILRIVEEISADLIVMGTHGAAASGRTLLGSVARRVLSGVRCAIVTVSLSHGLGAESEANGSETDGAKSSTDSMQNLTPVRSDEEFTAWVGNPAA